MKLLAFLFDVSGRVRRRDFWLFCVVILATYSVMWSAIYDQAMRAGVFSNDSLGGVYGLLWFAHNDLAFIGFIVMQLMTLAVIIKRLHDRDRSGFWSLALLVPVIGWGWLMCELALLPGTDGMNRYGPSPRGQSVSF